MKRVAIFASELLPYSETFIREQARALRRWHPVLVGRRLAPKGLSLDGLEVRLLTGGLASPLQRLCCAFCSWAGWSNPLIVAALRRQGCELVHAHFGVNAIDVWPAARKLGIPMLVSLHGYDITIERSWWEAGHGGIHRRRYPARLLNLAVQPNVRFVAVSRAMRERAVALGIPADKISVHHIGVDTSRFRPGDTPINRRARRVLFIGRLVEKKGCAYLIRAMARVRREVPDAELVVVGTGVLRPELERLAAETGVEARFVGALPSDGVKHELDRARVLCLPSVAASNGDAEGLGMVLLEAQACGVPVVTSSRGAIGEALVHEKTGFEFPEGDVATMASYLTLLLRDDSTLLRMSAAAVEFVKREFDLAACTARLEALYDSLAGSSLSSARR